MWEYYFLSAPYVFALRRTDFSVIKLENNEKYMFRYGNISVDSGFLCGKARNLRRDFPFILLDYSVKCWTANFLDLGKCAQRRVSFCFIFLYLFWTNWLTGEVFVSDFSIFIMDNDLGDILYRADALCTSTLKGQPLYHLVRSFLAS